ncbi:MAG: quinone-dependent dihydroorotate dehydrogenase [Alphaproteobacteria bacterium]|nr:quinone-dependent dihydroorotate dehydrogenase [Alphaproteobacteria bacterium]
MKELDPYRLLRSLLFSLPPEVAHRWVIAALRLRLPPAARAAPPGSLRINAFGMNFSSPLGMAAGFDKNAEACDALLAQGFGFVETGTVTPQAQQGNPRPRLFRLAEDEAVINRMGFNGGGVEAFVRNLRRHRRSGIVGANIGKNRDSADAVRDYVTLLEAVSPHVDYVTVNISSPNTAGLRALQERDALDALLQALMEKREALPRRLPLLLKIAPDLTDGQREAVAEVTLARKVDGLIVGNTTTARPPGLKSPWHGETGGLSGKPLFSLSTEMLRDMYRLTGGRVPLVGVGGISSAADAYAKIRAGATLLQLYTGIIYQGFGLVREIHEGLAEYLARDGFAALAEAVGTEKRDG